MLLVAVDVLRQLLMSSVSRRVESRRLIVKNLFTAATVELECVESQFGIAQREREYQRDLRCLVSLIRRVHPKVHRDQLNSPRVPLLLHSMLRESIDYPYCFH